MPFLNCPRLLTEKVPGGSYQGTAPLHFIVPQRQHLQCLLGPPQEDRSDNSLANWLKSLSF